MKSLSWPVIVVAIGDTWVVHRNDEKLDRNPTVEIMNSPITKLMLIVYGCVANVTCSSRAYISTNTRGRDNSPL
jgi:hypothetical protein